MKINKILIIALAVLVVAGTAGFFVFKAISGRNAAPTQEEQTAGEPTPVPAASTIVVKVNWSPTAANTVVLSVSDLANGYASVGYELTYESQGLIKGVNSGSKPIDVTGKDSFTREIYLGTCSRNVCKPDLGVKTVSVALEFTDNAGQKSEFTKDFEL